MSDLNNTDLTNRDYEGFKQSLLTGLKAKIPEYSDFSDYDPGVTILQLLAYALDGLSYYNDRAVQELTFDTAQNIKSVVKIANQFDYTSQGSTPAKYMQVFEVTPQLTDYTIGAGTRVTTNDVNVTDREVYELDTDLIIPAGKTGLEKDVDGNYIYQVSVSQGVSVKDAILGTSSGGAYQNFRIPDTSVITDSIEIWVNEGQGYVKWSLVDNFINSFADDLIYRITFDGAYHYVEFGSGTLGKIPSVYVNGIITNYRVGGGEVGNVGANTITQLSSPLAVVVQTFNPYDAYAKGTDAEDIEDIKTNSIAKLRAMNRAVTLQDYKDLAIYHLPYVKKIIALNTTGTTVDLYVLTDDDATTGLISASHVTDLQSFYDDKRMINTLVNVHNPTFLVCNLSLTLWVLDNFSASDTQALVLDYLQTQLALGNYDFGEELLVSALIRDIMNIPGVKSVSVTVTSNGGQTLPNSSAIVKLGSLTWDVRGGI